MKALDVSSNLKSGHSCCWRQQKWYQNGHCSEGKKFSFTLRKLREAWKLCNVKTASKFHQSLCSKCVQPIVKPLKAQIANEKWTHAMISPALSKRMYEWSKCILMRGLWDKGTKGSPASWSMHVLSHLGPFLFSSSNCSDRMEGPVSVAHSRLVSKGVLKAFQWTNQSVGKFFFLTGHLVSLWKLSF